MAEEKKMSYQEQVNLAVKIAEMVKEATSNGGDPVIILNTAASLSLGSRWRLSLDPSG